MSIPSGLGAALRRWRKAADLNQDEVAVLAGCSQPTISGIETGAPVGGTLLLRLIGIYKPPADELAREMGATSDDSAAVA